LIGAVIFSWIGDMVLMIPGEKSFMIGLGSFLIAQILYVFVYRQHRWDDLTNSLQGLQRIRFAFPVILAGAGLVTILYPHLGELRIPVIIYALVITVMTINALLRFGRTNSTSFAMVFGGAILFMISDSILAINKFLDPIYMGEFWIMLCYISAQHLIIRGLIQHMK
jgi:uncharacterized membrane protein YhhN